MNKHKVFISYHHASDELYRDHLLRLSHHYDLFDDYSVRIGEIDDNLPAESIRVKIRDSYIKNATVLILLCGLETKNRKHVDWEIHAAMFNTENNPQLGIVVINLPGVKNRVRAFTDEEKRLVSPNSTWTSLNSREQYESAYQHMPVRIIDNFVKDVPISVVDWETVQSHPSMLKELVDIAFKRRKQIKYDHSRIIRRNNS